MPAMSTAIAGVYHLLFPARPTQLDFLAALAGNPPRRVLDVACGAGEYVAALLVDGYDITGLELSLSMIEAALLHHPQLAGAVRGASGPNRMLHGDMLELFDLTRGPYDLVYCIGNSLPQLESLAQVAETLAQMYELTRPAGRVALQIVNYDRVLAGAGRGRSADRRPAAPTAGGPAPAPVCGIPMPPLTATTEDGTEIQLQRETLPLDAEHVLFRTRLRIGDVGYEEETPLLALTRERLATALPRGAQAECYGDFARAAWTSDSPATVVVLS
jgi:SAM-dependent methyltransferase